MTVRELKERIDKMTRAYPIIIEKTKTKRYCKTSRPRKMTPELFKVLHDNAMRTNKTRWGYGPVVAENKEEYKA